jgi:hypothetical protein
MDGKGVVCAAGHVARKKRKFAITVATCNGHHPEAPFPVAACLSVGGIIEFSEVWRPCAHHQTINSKDTAINSPLCELFKALGRKRTRCL